MRFLTLPLLFLFAACASPHLVFLPTTLHPIYAPPLGHYCYAPSAIQDGSALHLFACQNPSPWIIRDHLYYFHIDPSTTAVPKLALSPSNPPNWDSYHVCDPSVIQGLFHFHSTTYQYALFYLGNNVDASLNNQIGVAFSHSLAGPWDRMSDPLIPDPPTHHRWGTGQPSAISLDHAGKLLLFYTRSWPQTAGYVRTIDLANAAHPILSSQTRLSTKGLARSDRLPDYFNNFDVVYDDFRNRFIAIRDQRPHPATTPAFIGSSLQLLSLPARDLFSPAATWTVLADLTPAITHFPRNHNAGFVRDPFGRLPTSHSLTLLFTSSKQEPQLAGLFAPFTY